MSDSDNRTRGQAMPLHCPHCLCPIDFPPSASQNEVHCSTCGGSFHLQADRTRSWSSERLPKLDRFELIECVGRGAFGTVYRARDDKLQRTVAVKVPASGQLSTDDDEERLVREARSAAQLRHPGIVAVYEVGRGDAFPYIVCEFVDGVTLADVLTARKFSPRNAASLVAEVADAVDHAHQQGIVHRDLKPSNIMLTRDNAPRVMDFGLAKRDAGEITMTVEGQVLGTPAYMSPEQAAGRGHQVDGRSDVYSLGSILYELITGELPFRGNQRMLLHQVLNDEPRAPRSLNDQLPRDLETICLKAMSKDPARRYPTAKALANDLRRYLAGQPIEARPVGRLERGWRWCRRNPAVAALSAAVMLALVSGTVVSAYFAADAIAQQGVADAKAREALASADSEAKARAQADAEAKRAGLEAAKAQEVATFLANLFEESSSFAIAGLRFGNVAASSAADLTAREILDRGDQRIAELEKQPLVQAALKDTIGNVYLGLGMIDRAEVLLQQAYEFRQKELPADHPDLATSLHSMGMLRFGQSRYLDSAQFVEHALEIRQKQLGDDHELVDTSRTALATILGLYKPNGYQVDAPRAVQLSRESLAWHRRHFGDKHPQTAMMMVIAAGCLLNGGQNDEAAAKLILEATPVLSKNPATRTVAESITHFQRAVLLDRFGNKSAAQVATLQGLETAKRAVNSRHPFMRIARIYTVEQLLGRDEYAIAEKLCREWVGECPDAPADYSAVETGLLLAWVLGRKGDREAILAADDELRKCVGILHKLDRVAPPEFSEAVNRIAHPLRNIDGARAQSLCETAWDLGKRSYLAGPVTSGQPQRDPESCVRLAAACGSVFRANGKLELAESVYQEAFPLADEAPDNWRFYLTSGYAELVQQRGDSARAIEMLRTLLGQFESKLLAQLHAHPNQSIEAFPYANAAMSLGRILRAAGKPDEAEAVYRECLPTVSRHKDEFFAMLIHNDWGDLKRYQGQPDQALNHYEEALRIAVAVRAKKRELGEYWRAYLEPFAFRANSSAPWTVSFFRWAAQAGAAPADLSAAPPLATLAAGALDFDWVEGSPDPHVPADGFATVATAEIELPAGKYRVRTLADDGVRVKVDGQILIDRWSARTPTIDSAHIDLSAGRHAVRVEHFEAWGGAVLKLAIEPVAD